ncbi:MAG: formate dehydrogenase accessory protein FdhE, partial [Candidatus Sulfotelmatobacter sp.]
MANTLWQQRIRRAQHLSTQHSFAAEILGFYIHIARFQEGLYQRIDSAFGENAPDRRAGVAPALLQEEARTVRPLPDQHDAGAMPNPLSATLDLAELVTNFSAFLSLVEEKAPARLAQVAHFLRNSSASSWSDLLSHCWSTTGPPTDPQEFLALAFLQPCAELVRFRAALQPVGYTLSLCPFCNRKPALGVLRPQGDGARRGLVCGFCLAEWEFRRIVCPGCGEEDNARLPVYTAESFPYIRVECCDSCHTYIKSIDLTK